MLHYQAFMRHVPGISICMHLFTLERVYVLVIFLGVNQLIYKYLHIVSPYRRLSKLYCYLICDKIFTLRNPILLVVFLTYVHKFFEVCRYKTKFIVCTKPNLQAYVFVVNVFSLLICLFIEQYLFYLFYINLVQKYIKKVCQIQSYILELIQRILNYITCVKLS